MYSTKYGNFFLFKNEEFISEPMKKGIHWDQPILDIILPYLQKNDLVIDVGAHVGCHTIPYAQRVKQVYSFEPQEPIYQLLTRNLAINQIQNVKTARQAIGHLNSTTVSLHHQCQDGVSKHELVSYETDKPVNYGGIQLGTGAHKVTMMTLDSYEFPGPIKYLKVDAEGSEPMIFYGARDLLRRDRPMILYEKRDATVITRDMKSSMTIPPDVEKFSVEDYCQRELDYHRPIALENSNFLLIPKHISLPKLS
jgi:FkbM family methyltransferase